MKKNKATLSRNHAKATIPKGPRTFQAPTLASNSGKCHPSVDDLSPDEKTVSQPTAKGITHKKDNNKNVDNGNEDVFENNESVT